MNKILLIDDNEDILFTVKEVIKEFIPNMEIYSTQSGLDGINIANAYSPDVIILDVRMPDMDGYETCKILKNGEQTNFIPIIMFSAIDRNSCNMVKGLECGADIFLRKPVENEELVAQINAALRIKKAEDFLREQNILLSKDIKKTKNLYEDLFNGINDAVIIHDIEGEILEVNSKACLMFGYEKEEFLGKKIGDVAGNYENQYTDLDNIELKDYFNKGNVLFETMYVDSKGKSIPVEINSRLFIYNNKPSVLNVIRNITERKLSEQEKEATIQLFKLINSNNNLEELMKLIIIYIKNWSKCESVGIRLKEGEDYPYYVTRGFSDEFIMLENTLCAKDINGQIMRDETGNPVIECMCGNVICGRFDPKKDFFTEYGSFWSNCTTELLTSTSEADRQSRTRNKCNGEGYESVALIPLKTNEYTFGLIQLNDKRKNRFSKNIISMFERISNHIAIALSGKKTISELKKSEELYRSLFENMLNGYAYCRVEFENGQAVDWKYITVNSAFEKLTGLKDIVGKNVKQIIPGIYETSRNLFDIYGRVASSGNPEKFESFIETLKMWFEVSVFSPAKGDFVAVFDVVTDRKTAEQKLKESEERFRSVIEKSHDGIALVDEKGVLVIWNTSLEKQTSIKAYDVLGKYIWDVQFMMFPEEQRTSIAYESLKTKIMEFMKTGKSSWADNFTEGNFIHTDGSKSYLEWYISSIKTNNGYLLVNVSRDITERKSAEQNLKESEERFRLSFENANIGMCLVDLEGKILKVNEKMTEIFGYSPEELENITVNDIALPEYKNVSPEFIKKSIELKMDKASFIKKYYHKNKNIITCLVTSSMVRNNNNEPLYFVSHMLDVTDQMENEEELKKSVKEKEVLLRELYHRTKNNMMVISSLLKLESYYINDDKIKDFLREVENKITSMAMVHQMLYQTHSLSKINLKDYIENLAKLLKQSYFPVNERINFSFDLIDINVMLDTAIPFGMVLNELMTNSFKYAFPENNSGVISISLKKNYDEDIVFIYSDNGIGVKDNIILLDQKSLGIQTVISLVREQMQGDIRCTPGNGLHYHIKFKDNIYHERI